MLRARHGIAPFTGQIEHLLQLVRTERLGLGCALDLHIVVGAGHDDVHVDFGSGILFVREIEKTFAVDDAN